MSSPGPLVPTALSGPPPAASGALPDYQIDTGTARAPRSYMECALWSSTDESTGVPTLNPPFFKRVFQCCFAARIEFPQTTLF